MRGALAALAAAAALAASGCAAPGTIVRERAVEAAVPVPQPCAASRPERPRPLAERTPGWAEMDARQKAAAVGGWALAWVAYGEALDAATAACPESE